MPRKILTPEERVERKKAAARKVFERYRTYSGNDRGNPEQWSRAAEDVLHHVSAPCVEIEDPYLAILGLSREPLTMAELKTARRVAFLSTHEDKGGSHEGSLAVNEAYEKIKTRNRW